MSTTTFQPVPDSPLEVANFSQDSPYRIMIFRPNNPEHTNYDVWENVYGNILLIGGPYTKHCLQRLMNQYPYHKFNKIIPGGISSRTYTGLKRAIGAVGPQKST